MNFAPVECGDSKCTYDNSCLSEAAGFSTGECCPKSSTDVACSKELAPVKCGDTCVYDNKCLASAAGYDEMECCPTVPEDTACNMDFDPVMCGRNSCRYDNSCLAEGAGFDFDSCVPEPQPTIRDEGGSSASNIWLLVSTMVVVIASLGMIM